MNEFIVTLIFIVFLVSGVYFYAGYLTRTGKAEDADGNFIPDSWEEKFGWFFTAKGLIMLVLGFLLGYFLGNSFPLSWHAAIIILNCSYISMIITRKPNRLNSVTQLVEYSVKGYSLLFSIVLKKIKN